MGPSDRVDRAVRRRKPSTIAADVPAGGIKNGRVEVGMTKEQVLMSLGYPPTHRTASTDLDTWVYWYTRWKTYNVMFNEAGTVEAITGRAPTVGVAVAPPTPLPTATPAKRGKGK
ncbi:MAG: outer membrane protein assembly factor BamE [Ardenticatenales bacterium]